MALFDFSEADRIFREEGEESFRLYQKERIDEPADPGIAFNLVRKLLRVNEGAKQPVEVFIVSKNDPFSGLRVFESAKHHLLPITRGIFTRGRSPFPYLRAIRPTLFLSESEADVRAALEARYPSAHVMGQAPQVSNAHPDELRIALDGDGVLFDDNSERLYSDLGLEAFLESEANNAQVPMEAGPLVRFVTALKQVQVDSGLRLRLALVTARNAPAHERALRTLDDWGLEIDEAFFLGGMEKAPFLKEFGPDLFFDDQRLHTQPAAGVAAVAHVPYGVRNATALPSVESAAD